MRDIQFLAIFFILFLGCNSSRNMHETQAQSEYDLEFIDDLFKDFDGEKPGASVIVIKNGEIEFAKSYGYADLENNILATPKTNYRIASVTKQFTAMGVMILINQGKLTYQTKLTDIFPEFPRYGKDITVRQLLTHRSGLVKYNRFIEEDRTQQMLDIDVLNGLLTTDSTYFQPNTKYAYSNTGYAVLAQIIEKVSGMSFPDFMKKEIFRPLKMRHSTILEIGKEIKHRAYGHIVKGNAITPKDQSLTSAIQGDGGVYASVMDYYQWDKALYSDKLIPQHELDDAFYNYDENGKSQERGYGYGWGVNYHKGIKILQHGGSSTGFGSYVIRIPSANLSVAIFTNRNKRGQGLSNRAKALVSLFSNRKFQMPFEIVLEMEIDQNGIESGINKYNQIKADTSNYAVTKGGLFSFGISYINKDRNSDALELFLALISDYPDYFGGYYGSAIVYQQAENTEKAIESFEKTIERCSENEEWASEHAQKMIEQLRK